MLRALLMAISALGCMFMGAYASNSLRRRHDTAQAMLSGIMELSMRMQYSAQPIKELAISCKSPETEVFWDRFVAELSGKSVHRAWKEAMGYARERDAGFASLQSEELSILEEYSRSLGGSDLKSQAKNAALLEKRMEPVVSSCMNEYTRKGRIYKSMGVLSGLAVVILLW